MKKPETAIAWLWHELEAMYGPQATSVLKRGYNAQSRIYQQYARDKAHAERINTTKETIKRLEENRKGLNNAIKESSRSMELTHNHTTTGITRKAELLQRRSN